MNLQERKKLTDRNYYIDIQHDQELSLKTNPTCQKHQLLSFFQKTILFLQETIFHYFEYHQVH